MSIYPKKEKKWHLPQVLIPLITFKRVLLLLYCMSVYRKRKEVSLPLPVAPNLFAKIPPFPETRRFFYWKIKLFHLIERIFFFTLALQGIPAEGGVLLFEGNVRPSVLARRKRSASSLVPLWAELSGSVPEKRSLPSLAGFPNLFCKNFSFPQSLKIFHWKIKLLRIDGRISFFTLALLGIPA